MPTAFTQHERAHIRAALQSKGYELFAAYGIKKTSVEELAKAAGISKGAFYLFYDSKEELFFELLEQYEVNFQSVLLGEIQQIEMPPLERMRSMLTHAVGVWKQDRLFSRFGKDEYEYLLRKLPPERIQAHIQNDEQFANVFAEAWEKTGVTLACEPKLVSGLIRSLFFVSMHEDEFGGIYPQVIEALVDMLARRLIIGAAERTTQ
jgi:AcrR family transcriptional regulator